MGKFDCLRGWLAAFLVGSIVLTGCSEQKKKTEKTPVKVETLTVGSNANGETNDYVGTIEEKTGSTLSFELGGNITSIRVDEGDKVSRGQTLATINPTTLKEAHKSALATLHQAQDAYRRFLPLHKAGTISDIRWVEIESKLEQAKAAEGIARQQLTHSTITAPFSGVIASKEADLGTYVLPGQPVLKLADVTNVNAKISVPEAEISHLHIGDKVRITVAALGNAEFIGAISEKGIDANPISHTYEIKVGIANSQRRLLPGMVCNAKVLNLFSRMIQIKPLFFSSLFFSRVDKLNGVCNSAVLALSLFKCSVCIVACFDEVHHLAEVNKLIADDFIISIKSNLGNIAVCHLKITGALCKGAVHCADLRTKTLTEVLKACADCKAVIGKCAL